MTISTDRGIQVTLAGKNAMSTFPVLSEGLFVASSAHLLRDIEPVTPRPNVIVTEDIMRSMAGGTIRSLHIPLLTFLSMNTVLIKYIFHGRTLRKAPSLVMTSDTIHLFKLPGMG